MGKYILKRVGYMFLTLFVVVTITFFLMRAIPGDPLATMARALPEQTRQAFYARYGLDRPLFEQYLTYMKNLLRLDLGESLLYAGRSVSGTIASTSPISGLVGGIALLIGTVIVAVRCPCSVVIEVGPLRCSTVAMSLSATGPSADGMVSSRSASTVVGGSSVLR